MLNCLQPIVILLLSVGSTAIEGSFAASPTMLLPCGINIRLVACERTKARNHSWRTFQSENVRRRHIVCFRRCSFGFMWPRAPRSGGNRCDRDEQNRKGLADIVENFIDVKWLEH